MSDECVAEIYAARKEMMDECGGDLKELGKLIQQSQDEDPSHLITEVPETEPEPAATTGL